MLLFFWRGKSESILGSIYSLTWHHTPDYRPLVMCGCQNGATIINPFLYDPIIIPECARVLTGEPCYGLDVYNNQLLLGTMSSGVLQITWQTVKDVGCSLGNPIDLFRYAVQSYNTASGILSDSIMGLDSYGDNLVIMTASGLSYFSNPSAPPINYATTSGGPTYVTEDGCIYVCDGSNLKVKNCPILDFSSWDSEWSFTDDLVGLAVNRNTVFTATSSGVYVITQSGVLDLSPTVAGELISDLSVEFDSKEDWGHLFISASGSVDIINLKTKLVEKTITYSGSVFAVETPRIYSK